MQIRDINRIEKPNAAKKKKKSANGDFSIFMNDDNDSANVVNEAQGVSQVTSILSLQEIDNQDEVRRRNYDRGERLLGQLEHYQKALLSGQVDSNSLKKMQKTVQEERQHSNDAKLESILDDIELRAAVEAAKLEQD